jgi:hypothetical protein
MEENAIEILELVRKIDTEIRRSGICYYINNMKKQKDAQIENLIKQGKELNTIHTNNKNNILSLYNNLFLAVGDKTDASTDIFNLMEEVQQGIALDLQIQQRHPDLYFGGARERKAVHIDNHNTKIKGPLQQIYKLINNKDVQTQVSRTIYATLTNQQKMAKNDFDLDKEKKQRKYIDIIECICTINKIP